ncbi:MAG: hypothetical protein WBP58_10730 [Chitinophagaceae bacterium]
MQKFFTIVILLLNLTSYGQKGKFIPFKLVILKPDTAVIEKSLYGDIEIVQSDFLERYYSSVQQIEKLVNSKDFQSDTNFKAEQEQMKLDLSSAKAVETEIKKFKYFQTLSTYSTEVYNFYFNEYEPYSTIIELNNQKTDIQSIRKLADTTKADYVVYFSNVHTVITDGLPILRLTTSVYSKKEDKVILRKETEGDTKSRGGMWTCGKTTLSCLLINGVRTSTNEIAPIIAKEQMRR